MKILPTGPQSPSGESDHPQRSGHPPSAPLPALCPAATWTGAPTALLPLRPPSVRLALDSLPSWAIPQRPSPAGLVPAAPPPAGLVPAAPPPRRPRPGRPSPAGLDPAAPPLPCCDSTAPSSCTCSLRCPFHSFIHRLAECRNSAQRPQGPLAGTAAGHQASPELRDRWHRQPYLGHGAQGVPG